MFVGEAPGKDEKIGKKPFIGKSGKEFNQGYLPLAGLHRGNVYVTNATKCWWSNGGEAPPEDVMHSCAEFHLRREIIEVEPEVIVPMGVQALNALKHLGIANEKLDMDIHHGTWIRDSKIDPWIFPVYHPAAGMRMARFMLALRTDFETLRQWPKWRTGVGPTGVKMHKAGLVKYPDELKRILNRDWSRPMAIDTESDPYDGTWCLTFSVEPGEAWMIRAKYDAPGNLDPLSAELFDGFNHWLTRWKATVYMHYGLHDIKELAQLGVAVPYKRLQDTMMMAYHRGYLPQGLKALAWRLLRLEMREYKDVVQPHSEKAALDWLFSLSAFKFDREDPVWVLDPKTGKEKLYWAQPLHTKVKRMLTDHGKGKTVDPFKRWKAWLESEKAMATRVKGSRFPYPSIAHVPFEEALEYACSDANSTLQVGTKLETIKIRRG